MNHFQRLRTAPDLAETTEGSARLHALLLLAVEMKESKVDGATAVTDSTDQRATPPEDYLGGIDLTLDQRFLAEAQGADWCQAGPVLIPQGQMKEQVRNAKNTEMIQNLSKLRPDPGQRFDTVSEACPA